MSQQKQRFVLFPLGGKRFALPASQVSELSRPDDVHTFPHTSKLLSGVLLRRGKIIPVLDVAQVVLGPNAPSRKFYLIANRQFDKEIEWTAIPVTGECELKAANMVPPTGKLPPYVIGLLSFDDEIVEVIDIDKLASLEAA
jgi:purine-binding chemotaxis protein CheW